MARARVLPLQRMESATAADGSLPAFSEPLLCYEPPYERSVDDQMAWLLVRHLNPATDLAYRVPVRTTVGSFVLDFVASRGTRRVGFVLCERDGEAAVRCDPYWHAMVLATGAVDTIYCVEGSRLDERVVDVLSVVAGWQAELFSPDGLAELAARSTEVSASLRVRGTGAEVSLDYTAPIDDWYRDEAFAWPADGTDEVRVSRRGSMGIASRAADPPAVRSRVA
ncbi:MAG TPA: hypothetical protein VF190_12360 [Rhodothermales bacterium]